jgi:hypothetical protein
VHDVDPAMTGADPCLHGALNAYRLHVEDSLDGFCLFLVEDFLIYSSGSLPTDLKNQSTEDHGRYVLYP